MYKASQYTEHQSNGYGEPTYDLHSDPNELLPYSPAARVETESGQYTRQYVTESRTVYADSYSLEPPEAAAPMRNGNGGYGGGYGNGGGGNGDYSGRYDASYIPPRSPSAASHGSRRHQAPLSDAGSLRLGADPYANLPPMSDSVDAYQEQRHELQHGGRYEQQQQQQQQQQQRSLSRLSHHSGDRLGSASNLSGRRTPQSYSNGHAGAHYFQQYRLSQEDQQQQQQHEYVNYTDPEMVAARQSLEATGGALARTDKFGTMTSRSTVAGGRDSSLAGSKLRIVAYEQDTGGQGLANPGYTDVEDYYRPSSGAASPYANYQSNVSVASRPEQRNFGSSVALSARDVSIADGSTMRYSVQQEQHQHYQQQQQQVTMNGGQAGYRNPELPDLIEYLRSGSDTTKCHAAAYIQHLTFCEEETKGRVRTAGGIPLLVRLLAAENSELRRNALGALRNISYGRSQEENKREMCRVGLLPELRHIIDQSADQESRELASAVLWNISGCQALKREVIDTCVDTLVQRVLLPHAGLERRGDAYANAQREIYWTVLFRNASGVVRSVSSCGDYARRRLRSTDGLVESLLQVLQCAVDNNDMDNKAVENCVCTVRNLVFACQEVEDPSYLKQARKKAAEPERGPGCFGRSASSQKSSSSKSAPIIQRRLQGPARGMDLLWQLDIVPLLLPIVADCTNPETLEAAAGAIQNLAACDWQPSVEIRVHVRKESGLPLLVELLSLQADRVVQTAATALRNLAQDERNRDLIGKYALEALVARLPDQQVASASSAPSPAAGGGSSETQAAVVAALYTVVKDNAEFAGRLVELGGVHRLMRASANERGDKKVASFANTLLAAIWKLKELQPTLKQHGWTEADFTKRPGQRAKMGGASMSQSGPGARQNSVPRSQLVHRQQQQPQQQQQQGVPRSYENSGFVQQPAEMSSMHEPTYAQVDRGKKLQQRQAEAADSWV